MLRLETDDVEPPKSVQSQKRIDGSFQQHRPDIHRGHRGRHEDLFNEKHSRF
jgi:hypothetical protein